MTLRRYLAFLGIGTGLSWFSWLLVLFRVSPDQVGGWGVLLFFLSLFMALWGTFSLVGMVIRFLLLKREIIYYQVVNSYRQGVFASCILVVMLALQSFRILRWWNALLLIIGISVVEYYFLSKQKTIYNER